MHGLWVYRARFAHNMLLHFRVHHCRAAPSTNTGAHMLLLHARLPLTALSADRPVHMIHTHKPRDFMLWPRLPPMCTDCCILILFYFSFFFVLNMLQYLQQLSRVTGRSVGRYRNGATERKSTTTTSFRFMNEFFFLLTHHYSTTTTTLCCCTPTAHWQQQQHRTSGSGCNELRRRLLLPLPFFVLFDYLWACNGFDNDNDNDGGRYMYHYSFFFALLFILLLLRVRRRCWLFVKLWKHELGLKICSLFYVCGWTWYCCCRCSMKLCDNSDPELLGDNLFK